MVKYFKLSIANATEIDERKIDSICEQIVNLIFSKTYFVDGKINPTPKPILYQTDTFDYEFHGNVMNILIFAEQAIEAKLNNLVFDGIKRKVDELKVAKIYLPFCLPECSQYTTIEVGDVPIVCLKYGSSNQVPQPFEYVIYFVDPKRYIMEIISREISCEQDPLWTCIIDCKNVFTWPDAHLSVGFPTFHDLTLVKTGHVFQDQLLLNGQRHILVEEVAKIYGQSKKLTTKDPSIFDKKLDLTNYTDKKEDMLDHDMYYQVYDLDFNDPAFKPIARMPNTSNPIVDILQGALQTEQKSNTIDDGFEYEDSKKELVCYLTGLPLYDEAYVLDIYRQKFVRRIKAEDINKYPGATQIDGYYQPHIETKYELQIYIEERETVVPLFQFRTFADIEKEKAFIEQEMKKQKKKTSTDEKLVKTATKPTGKRPDGMIDIEYEVHYDTPRCIMVSPYFVHSRGGNNYPLNLFAQATLCHFIVWKVKLPVSFADCVKTLPISEEKKLLYTEIDKRKIKNTTVTDNFRICTDRTTFNAALIEKIMRSDTQPQKLVCAEFVVPHK